MKILILKAIIVIVTVTSTRGECDVCHTTNNEACHSETEYSLCIRGNPNKKLITCPEDFVCTSGPYVCYPRAKAEASCKRTKNLCGVCSVNKIFACLNETTIAFCYGEDKPDLGSGFSYCLGDSVCDIKSKNGYCTERKLAQPSCVTPGGYNATDIPNTTEPDFSTAAPQPGPTTITTVSSTATAEQTTSQAGTTKPLTKITESATKQTSTVLTTTTTEATITLPESTTARGSTTTITLAATKNPTTSNELMTTKSANKRLNPDYFSTTQLTPGFASTATPEPTTAAPSTSGERTTAPLVPRSPNAICRDAASTGSFAADDPSCKTFVVCYTSGGSLAGIKKSCRSGQYFPPGAAYCSSEKPYNCI